MKPISKSDIDFFERLNRHPALKQRMKLILDLTENTEGDLIKADDAERRTIESVRQLGSEIMHDWANRQVDSSTDQLRTKEKGIEGNGKKK